MRREALAVVLIAAAAFAIRLYPAWNGVFGGPITNFLETDAWYHLRLIENQVRNFPWRVSVDPYAGPDGQFVPIAPLFDTLTASAVVVLHGRDADARAIERIAAFVPPILGTLAIVAVWAAARRVFGVRAALLSAVMLTVLPGHFMDRTMLGFVDHHALEALLAVATILAVVAAIGASPAIAASDIPESSRIRWLRDVAAGVALGAYLLGWGSGAFLIAILVGWVALLVLVATTPTTLTAAARVAAVAAVIALALVLLFQNPAMHRFGSQVVGLVVLVLVAAIVGGMAARSGESGERQGAVLPRRAIVAMLAGAGTIGVITASFVQPALVSQLVTDVGRLAPDPSRMGVLEARPLFTYPGEVNWQQPWQFFRTGFYVGVAALVPLGMRIVRERRGADVLVWVFTATTIGATIGQNRFGYYMVPACALVGGWLADRLLALGDSVAADVTPSRRWLRQSLALTAVAAMIAPCLAPNLLFLPRTGMFLPYWEQALSWLRDHSPAPFPSAAGAPDEYYFARYDGGAMLGAEYSIMNWWDQGYYLIQHARRVPVSNPTQERAPNAAKFYTETDEARALERLRQERSRYVLADWELPFRLAPDGSIAGRFQTLADWAGIRHADYYEIAYRRTDAGWTPVWLFYEPYYRSMAYRLGVLGGRGMTPANATWVVTLSEHTDARGFRFREVVSEQRFATYEAARAVVMTTGSPATLLAGLDPWQAAFPLPPLSALTEVHHVRTPEQKPSEAPWVRVFQVR
jgi:oligosaccharyl transferase (archaeosortase A-associated)